MFAAGLSQSKGDVSKADKAGLKYFADLNKSGNFVPVIGKAASLAQGTTPIIVRWDYNALADRDTLKGNPKVQVVIPKTGVVAGVYVQRSARMRRIRTRPSCGWNTCTRTKARSAG